MIGKLTYDQVMEFVENLRKENATVKKLSRGRNVEPAMDFVDAVETYGKYLEGIIDLNRSADEAIKDLVK